MNTLMKLTIAAQRAFAALLLTLAFTAPACATLLGVNPGFPKIVLGSLQGQGATFDATSGALSITGVALYYQLTSSPATMTAFSGTSTQPAPMLQLGFTVDTTGHIIGHRAGGDFVLTGTTGTDLLTGNIDQFGFANQTTTTDAMDFVMNVTGGSMSELYGNAPVAIVLDLENSTFNGSFSQSFTSTRVKGALGTIPAPPTLWLFLAGLPAMLGAVRWRSRRQV